MGLVWDAGEWRTVEDMRRDMARKLNPEGRTYRRLAADLALSFCPPIVPCGECGYPTIEGYLCTYCQDKKETR